VKLPHGYTRSVSVTRLSDAAFRLHLSALDWCAEQKTNGQITRVDFRALPNAPTGKRLEAALTELVTGGLWSWAGTWQITDAEQADSRLSEKRAEAGRRGGLAKAMALAKQTPSNLLSKGEASGTDPSSPLVLPSPDSLSGSDSSLSQASAERPESFSLVGATEAKRARRKALSHLVPEGWEPSGEHRKIAREFGADFDLELAKFRDHEFATARSDWNRAFRNWLRKDQPRRFAKPPGAIQHAEHIEHNRRPESRRLDLPERRGGVGLAFGGPTK
jgi:hypothetical protein